MLHLENDIEINFNLCKHRFQSSHEKTHSESAVIEVEMMVKDDSLTLLVPPEKFSGERSS